MKTLLLTLTLVFSLSLAQADEGSKPRKFKPQNRNKITYSENKYKKTFVKRKNPKKAMFAGEGQVNGSHRFR
jgi:hypothetical protein